jgi:hypothetical protein
LNLLASALDWELKEKNELALDHLLVVVRRGGVRGLIQLFICVYVLRVVVVVAAPSNCRALACTHTV